MDADADAVLDLIRAAQADGYDVTITVTRRRDGAKGRLRLPQEWAAKLGVDLTKYPELVVKK